LWISYSLSDKDVVLRLFFPSASLLILLSTVHHSPGFFFAAHIHHLSRFQSFCCASSFTLCHSFLVISIYPSKQTTIVATRHLDFRPGRSLADRRTSHTRAFPTLPNLLFQLPDPPGAVTRRIQRRIGTIWAISAHPQASILAISPEGALAHRPASLPTVSRHRLVSSLPE